MNTAKIILCGYACSPQKGSEEGNSWSWATGLAKMGFEVWCFCNVAFEDEIVRARKDLNYPNLHFVFIRVSGFMDRKFLNPSSKRIYIHYALWRRKAAKLAVKMHAAMKFDIGHHVSFGSLQQGHFLWKLQGLKIIFGPVGGGQKAPYIFREYFGRAWKTERVRNLITKLYIGSSNNFRNSLMKSDYLLANNPETRELAKNTGYISEKKIHLIGGTAVPLAMENVPKIDRGTSETIRLIWVGRMLPKKGLNLVLEALSKLPSEFDYRFTIVGGGPLFSNIETWIRHFGLDRKKITITGQIPFEDVQKHYETSDVFIFCPLRETFGAQLSEAMAFGLAVITLNIHGASIGVPDNCGIKITPVTKEQTLADISKAIVKMKTDKLLRRQCSENAYEYSKNNTWEKRIHYIVKNYY